MNAAPIRMAAVGDVFVDRAESATLFAATRPLFEGADVVFGNCEGVYSDRASPAPSAPHAMTTSARHARALGAAGFDVMSCANNHSVDGGHAALLDMLDLLHGQGISTAGAGADIVRARQPAILERRGRRIALLAYSCVFPHGYEAREQAPGLAPLRVHTLYSSALPNFWNPGTAAEVLTVPHPPDLAAMRADIAAARAQADHVVVSCHWGDSSRPVRLLDYERELGHAAIEAGADAVLGHHHHSLRGVEFHLGRPILYGLGAFAFDLPNVEHHFSAGTLRRFRERHGEYAIGPRECYPTFPFHPECRMTAVAQLVFRSAGPTQVEFVPCVIQPAGHPQPFPVEEPEGRRVFDYLVRITREEGLATTWSIAQRHGPWHGLRACAATA